MIDAFDLWKFIGGIGLFLFAMSQLETALSGFAGGTLRRYLRQQANRPIKSVAFGALATALVQSSSLVGLMVMAFAGASVISLQSALGVILGANLGTTLTGWLVATLGFKLDLDDVFLPLVGLGTLILVGRTGRLAEVGRIMAGIGFLLMGLSLMKDSVGALSASIDIADLSDRAAWQYLVFGVVFAAVVQSSSATMMLTLAALNAEVIALPAAAAIVIGADLGTTSTMLIGSLRGTAGKKRVALAHVIINVTTAIFAFTLLSLLLDLVRSLGITDALISLVAFHSLFNFAGILLFLPLVALFAAFLERRFVSRDSHEGLYVAETDANVSEAALAAISKETAYIVCRVIRQNRLVFDPPLPASPGRLPIDAPTNPREETLTFDEYYRRNKRLEGEIFSFATKVQGQRLTSEQSERLSRLLSAVRHAINSAKSLRDIRHNLTDIGESPHAELFAYAGFFRSIMIEIYNELFRLRGETGAIAVVQDFAQLLNRIEAVHDQMHSRIYADVRAGSLADADISTLLNVNRELFNSNTSLVLSIQEYCLREEEAETLIQLASNT